MAEAIALGGLAAPLLLMLAAMTSLPLTLLEQAGLALFAILIGYLAGLTGGLQSPLIVWLVLVPAEAALAGGRRSVIAAGIVAALVLGAIAAVQFSGMLPPSRLALPEGVTAGAAILAALVQAGLIAAAARDQRRAADDAAAQGAAMYQLLAENAVDLITRHGPDGRIRFASPASVMLLGRSPAELDGLAPAALAHPDDLGAVQSAFLESAYFGREGSAEVRMRHAAKGYLWTEMRWRPAGPRVKGAPAEIVAVTCDMS